MPGTLFVVATPIGNLEDVTARALRILREVSLVAAEDTRRTAHLLARYAITTPTTSLHEHNETSKASSLIQRLHKGDSIALVSDAGTPTVSDPGQRLIRLAVDAGIRVEAIPGPSAILATIAASGIAADTFTFLGFPPSRSNARKKWLGEVKAAGRPVVFFEAPHRIVQTLEELQETIGNLNVAVGRELTKAHEELVRGQISEVLERLKEPKGEFTVIIDIGQMPHVEGADAPAAVEIASEFGRLIEHGRGSRRDAIRTLATRYGLSPNAVYAAIEEGKKSGD
jgi:16S rRNA (cytidine1402-2'-O)-methyltransferase